MEYVDVFASVTAYISVGGNGGGPCGSSGAVRNITMPPPRPLT